MSDTSAGVNIDSMLAAASAAPGLDPQSAYGIAQTTSDPSLAAESAQASQAFGETATAVATLAKQSASVQRQYWGGLSSTDQQMYRSAGYPGPPAAKHSSLLGSVVGAVGGAVSSAIGDATGAVTTAIGDVANAVQAPIREVQRAYRAAALVTDQNEQRDGSWGRWELGSPTQWARAWRDANHGEQTFLPSRVAALTQQYGEDTVALAKRIAGGQATPDDLIAAAPPEQKADLQAQLQSQDFGQVITQLQNAKISYGRRMVGEHLLNSNPELAHKIAGAYDAIADVAADPVVWGGKALKATELVPYILSDASRVGEILDKPAATRLMQAASDTLNEGGAGALIRKFPKFAPIAQQLVDEGVQSADDMKQWFSDTAGLKAIFEGKVGGFAPKGLDSGAVVPNISRVGLATSDLKSLGTQLLDFGSEKGIPGFTSAKRLTQLVLPAGARIDAESPDGLRNLQRLADYALPTKTADQYVSSFASANDQAARFGLYKGMLGEMFDRLNVPQAYRDSFFDSLDEAHQVRSYGVSDRMLVDGQSQPVGYLVNHVMDHGFTAPDFRGLMAQADRSNLMQHLYGAVNSDRVTRLMNTWKPAQLLRLGMPLRTGGEEAVGQALREGPLSVLRGRMAASAVSNDDSSILDRMVGFATSHLPNRVAEQVQTPTDLAAAMLSDRTSRAMSLVEGKLATPKYLNAASELAKLTPDAIPAEISAAHTGGAGLLSDVPNVVRVTRQGVEARPLYMTPDPSGAFRDWRPTEGLYTNMWKAQLDAHGVDPLAQAAASKFAEGRAAQVQAVVDRLGEDDMQFVRSKAWRATALPDGRLVGAGATQDEALRSWAETVVDNLNHLTSDPTGAPYDNLRSAVASQQPIDVRTLNAIPEDLRPTTVSGHEMMPVYGKGVWAEIQRRGFGYIGDSINWIAREPMMVHNYAQALDDVAPLRQGLIDLGQTEEEAAKAVREAAFTRALNATTPYIHDPAVRSQFAESVRNLAPFWFAQEQFFKRWALTLQHTPEAFREAQLTMMGLRHAGFVHTDPNGNDFFMYPGAGAVQSVLSKGASLALGHDVTLPIPVGFSGQVKFVTPGTERIGLPSFGPLVSIPMHAMATRFPELAQLEQQTLGDRGAGRPYWEQITPSSVSRVVHVLVDNPETSPQMHSAMLQAIQEMEASGHGLADDANPADQEKYLDRIKSWTRILMLNRAIFGFSVPAAPDLQMDPNHLNQDYRALLSKYPIDEATRRFLAAHPDATPFTVFQTKSEAGAPLPATTQAASFMADHADFLKSYPEAAAWFIPQTPSNNDFSMPAYREQLALGLREKKSTLAYWEDIKYAEAATDYFDTRDGRDKALADARAAGDHTKVAIINQQWSQFHDAYVKSHPVFAEQLMSPDAQIRRQRALDQLREALADPRLPPSPQNESIVNLLDTYDGLQSRLAQFQGRRDQGATEARQAATKQFTDWAHSYIQEHPEIEGLYNRVFRAQVGDSATTLTA